MRFLLRALLYGTYTFTKPVYKDSFLWNDKLGRVELSQLDGMIELHDATIYQNFRDDVQRYGFGTAVKTFFGILKILSTGTNEVIYEAKQ